MQLKTRFKYCLRNLGSSPWFRRKPTPGKTGIDSLTELVPVIFATTMLMTMLAWLVKIPVSPKLWIKSSSGKTIKTFPLFQALRIVRKHKWEFVETEPVKHISRMQALKILLRGDEKCRRTTWS